jgi:hypothetical protein
LRALSTPDAGDRHAGRHLRDREQRVEPARDGVVEVSGTPITGRSVCAAPRRQRRGQAGPAMITLIPRMCALRQ